MLYTRITAIYTNNAEGKALLDILFQSSIPTCICVASSAQFPPPPPHITYIDYPRNIWKVDTFHPPIYKSSEEECYKYEIKHFINNAIQLNPYNTTYFIWNSPTFLLTFPPLTLIKDVSLLFFCKATILQEKYFNTFEILSSKDTFVCLDSIVCKKESWMWYMQEYNMIVYQYIFNDATDVSEESFYSSLLYFFPREIQGVILYN